MRSLDQLYFQAVALNPILVAKVQAWATASGGYFAEETDSAQVPGHMRRMRSQLWFRTFRVSYGNDLPTASGLVPMFVRWKDVCREVILF